MQYLDKESVVLRTSSISHRTTDSTSGCFTTSLSTPPSPPPMTSTWKTEGTCCSWLTPWQETSRNSLTVEWYLLGTWMTAQRKVGNHFLIGKLISLCALDHTVQNQDISVGFTGEGEDNTAQDEAPWSSTKGILRLLVTWQNLFFFKLR